MLFSYPPAIVDLIVSTWFPIPHNTLLKFAAYDARLPLCPNVTFPTTLRVESLGYWYQIETFPRVYLLSLMLLGLVVVPISYQS